MAAILAIHKQFAEKTDAGAAASLTLAYYVEELQQSVSAIGTKLQFVESAMRAAAKK